MPVSYLMMMEGYIAGRVIIEAARRQGRAPTREAMASTLNAMNYYDLGGYVVGFRAGARIGSKYVEAFDHQQRGQDPAMDDEFAFA